MHRYLLLCGLCLLLAACSKKPSDRHIVQKEPTPFIGVKAQILEPLQ